LTCVGWQITLCDPIWQVTPRNSRTSSRRGLYSAVTLALTLSSRAACTHFLDFFWPLKCSVNNIDFFPHLGLDTTCCCCRSSFTDYIIAGSGCRPTDSQCRYRLSQQVLQSIHRSLVLFPSLHRDVELLPRLLLPSSCSTTNRQSRRTQPPLLHGATYSPSVQRRRDGNGSVGHGSWVKWVTIFGWVTWVTGHCH